MMENVPEKAIPNVVGRLDPVIDAIKMRDWIEAEFLCHAEVVRRKKEIRRMEEELVKKIMECASIDEFIAGISNAESREKILAEACR